MTAQHNVSEPADALFSTPAMARLFSPATHVRCMLLFEAALARAEARAEVIPQEAAHVITVTCQQETFDVAALYRDAAHAGTLAIPLVRVLTERVGGDAQRFVHWGATSQDAIDSALMLQMRDGIDLLIDGLLAIAEACATLAEQHRHTPMVGRTLLQQALPITFGLKAARWLALATRLIHSLRDNRASSLAVQLGGAAGTLASLGHDGLRVLALLAEELHLPVPDIPWHTERDRVAEIATTLGIVAGSMAKIAADLVLLAQTEIGEASEGAASGKGGSSAMPQKHNPVDAVRASAAARLAVGVVPVILLAMAQEHERAVGGWQAEWAAIPDLFRYTAGAVEGIRSAVVGLHVDAVHMQANLARTNGLIMAEALTMALAPHVGRSEAYRLVQDACNRVMKSGNITLHQVAQEDAQIAALLSPEDLSRVLDPTHYLGSTDAFIDRALVAYRTL